VSTTHTLEAERCSGAAGKPQLSPVQRDLLCEQLARKELSYYQPYTTFNINPLKPGQFYTTAEFA